MANKLYTSLIVLTLFFFTACDEIGKKKSPPRKEGDVSLKEVKTPRSDVRIGGDFVLTDQDGMQVDSTKLNDKYKLVFFGFTNCPSVCPTSMAVISTALTDIGSDVNKLYPIFISVDPERDKAEELQDFLEEFHPSFIGLTGTEEEIDKVKKDFRVFAEKADIQLDGMYDMSHSSIIYLFDKDWHYIRHFNHQDNSDAIAAALDKEL